MSGSHDSAPYWVDSAPVTRFPPLDGDLGVDVLIVGGGITGLTAAYLLARAGRSVAVLERERLGSMDSGHTSAHLTAVTDVGLTVLDQRVGRDHAQATWDAGFAAIAGLASSRTATYWLALRNPPFVFLISRVLLTTHRHPHPTSRSACLSWPWASRRLCCCRHWPSCSRSSTDFSLPRKPGMCRTKHTGASLARQYSSDNCRKRRSMMASGKSDELKGRVKEAAGVLTDDKKLKREGQVDQAAGKIKQKADKVIDRVKAAIS